MPISPQIVDIVAVLYTPRMERVCPYLSKLAIQGSKEVEEGIHAVLGEEWRWDVMEGLA